MPIAVRADWSEPRVSIPNAIQIGHLSIVADARIDNGRELAGELCLASDASVSELLANAYLTWEEGCAERLSGDFAFVLWDSRRQRLVAARDPFGVKPLYYRAFDDRFWITDRVSSLLETFEDPPLLDDRRVVEYLLGRYTPTEATFFKDIREIPPGIVLIATRFGVQHHRYGNPPAGPSSQGTIGRREYQQEFRRLFIQSVQRRLVSDKPVMIHVSGGLDSSAIAGAADFLSRAGALPAPTVVGLAALYPGLACDESLFIEAVARWITFPVQRWDGTQGDVSDLTDPHIAQPGIRASSWSGTTGDVTMARAHASSVILTGTGGDQLGSVDGFVRDLITDGRWFEALAEVLFFPGATVSSRLGRIKHVLKQTLPPDVLRLRSSSPEQVPSWLATDLRPLAASVHSALPIDVESANGTSLPFIQRYAWNRLTAPRMTRGLSTMNAHGQTHGVEYRFPFLDRELVRFTLTIPSRFWPRPGSYSRLHREPLRDLLPPEVASRFGKAEFTPALANRIRRASVEIGSLFENEGWASSRYVDKTEARRFWRSVTEIGSRSPSASWRQVWAIVTVEAWLRRVFEYNRRGPTKGVWP